MHPDLHHTYRQHIPLAEDHQEPGPGAASVAVRSPLATSPTRTPEDQVFNKYPHFLRTLSSKSKKRVSWHKASASLPNALPSQDSIDPPPLPLKPVNSFQNLYIRPTLEETSGTNMPLSTIDLQGMTMLDVGSNALQSNHPPSVPPPPIPSSSSSQFPSSLRSFPFPSPVPSENPPKRPVTSPPPLFSTKQVLQTPMSSTAMQSTRLELPRRDSKAKPVTIDVQKANEPFLTAYSVNRPILRKAKSQALLTRSPININYNTYSDLSTHNLVSPSSSTSGIVSQARNSNSNFFISPPDGHEHQQYDPRSSSSGLQLERPKSLHHAKRHSITSYIPVSTDPSPSTFHAYSSPSGLTPSLPAGSDDLSSSDSSSPAKLSENLLEDKLPESISSISTASNNNIQKGKFSLLVSLLFFSFSLNFLLFALFLVFGFFSHLDIFFFQLSLFFL